VTRGRIEGPASAAHGENCAAEHMNLHRVLVSSPSLQDTDRDTGYAHQSSEYRERSVRAGDEGANNDENDPLPDPPEWRIAPLPTTNQVEFLHRIAHVQPTIS
jgi:hypothetical protein